MRDIILIYEKDGRLCQSTYHGKAAQEAEDMLGERLIGKVVLAARQ